MKICKTKINEYSHQDDDGDYHFPVTNITVCPSDSHPRAEDKTPGAGQNDICHAIRKQRIS